MVKRLFMLAVITATVLTGCGPTPTRDPATISIDEALTVLRHAETQARARNVDGLCSVSIQSRETCEHLLRAAGGMAAVPNEAPTVVQSYVVPDTKLDGGSTAHGGRVLILKGTNGLGQPYRMEYVVFDKGNNHLVSLVAPYWFNSSFTRVGPEGWGTTSGPPPPIP